jgi:cation transport regulator ChaB
VNDLFHRLIKKCFNARAKAAVETYRENNTSRRSTSGVHEAHRTKLAAITEKNTKKRSKELMDKEDTKKPKAANKEDTKKPLGDKMPKPNKRGNHT